MKSKYVENEIAEILNAEEIQYLKEYFNVDNLGNLVLFLNAQVGIEYQTGKCYDELLLLIEDGVTVLNNCIYSGIINKHKNAWCRICDGKYVFKESNCFEE